MYSRQVPEGYYANVRTSAKALHVIYICLPSLAADRTVYDSPLIYVCLPSLAADRTVYDSPLIYVCLPSLAADRTVYDSPLQFFIVMLKKAIDTDLCLAGTRINMSPWPRVLLGLICHRGHVYC